MESLKRALKPFPTSSISGLEFWGAGLGFHQAVPSDRKPTGPCIWNGVAPAMTRSSLSTLWAADVEEAFCSRSMWGATSRGAAGASGASGAALVAALFDMMK